MTVTRRRHLDRWPSPSGATWHSHRLCPAVTEHGRVLRQARSHGRETPRTSTAGLRMLHWAGGSLPGVVLQAETLPTGPPFLTTVCSLASSPTYFLHPPLCPPALVLSGLYHPWTGTDPHSLHDADETTGSLCDPSSALPLGQFCLCGEWPETKGTEPVRPWRQGSTL